MNNDEFNISPLGDSALLISFGNIIDEFINNKVLSLFHKIKELSLPCIKDVVPAYCSLVVYFDVFSIKQNNPAHKTCFEMVAEELKKTIDNTFQKYVPLTRSIKVPVCYSKKYGFDMDIISNEKQIEVKEIIKLHSAKKYRIYMIGFLPGFAYMGGVDEKIAMPRKVQPRIKVEAGSVGIAGMQTGIYPLDSPGGWNIIGKTPFQLFNKEKDDPVLLQPGDEVEFYSISEDEFTNYQGGNT